MTSGPRPVRVHPFGSLECEGSFDRPSAPDGAPFYGEILHRKKYSLSRLVHKPLLDPCRRNGGRETDPRSSTPHRVYTTEVGLSFLASSTLNPSRESEGTGDSVRVNCRKRYWFLGFHTRSSIPSYLEPKDKTSFFRSVSRRISVFS